MIAAAGMILLVKYKFSPFAERAARLPFLAR